jgi:hypothetical protein
VPVARRKSPGKRAESALSRWQTAYRKAFKDYGSKAQAERIAWGAIDEGLQHESGRKPVNARRGRKRKAA